MPKANPPDDWRSVALRFRLHDDVLTLAPGDEPSTFLLQALASVFTKHGSVTLDRRGVTQPAGSFHVRLGVRRAALPPAPPPRSTRRPRR